MEQYNFDYSEAGITALFGRKDTTDLYKFHKDTFQPNSNRKTPKIILNNGKIVHGGYLATIADTGMGTVAHTVSNKKCVTISLEVKFISAGLLDQVLTGKITIQKKTRSLIFITCEIFNSEGIVITASGIWKIL